MSRPYLRRFVTAVDHVVDIGLTPDGAAGFTVAPDARHRIPPGRMLHVDPAALFEIARDKDLGPTAALVLQAIAALGVLSDDRTEIILEGSSTELARWVGLSRDTVNSYLAKLRLAHYAAQHEQDKGPDGRFGAVRWRIANCNGETASSVEERAGDGSTGDGADLVPRTATGTTGPRPDGRSGAGGFRSGPEAAVQTGGGNSVSGSHVHVSSDYAHAMADVTGTAPDTPERLAALGFTDAAVGRRLTEPDTLVAGLRTLGGFGGPERFVAAHDPACIGAWLGYLGAGADGRWPGNPGGFLRGLVRDGRWPDALRTASTRPAHTGSSLTGEPARPGYVGGPEGASHVANGPDAETGEVDLDALPGAEVEALRAQAEAELAGSIAGRTEALRTAMVNARMRTLWRASHDRREGSAA